nr:MAG TPA: hypothetical protein [Caudoviricetes sp.]DAL84870.1 MAG TPA: hypothetical protein [Caudoviricetes sp.]DAM04032.1 MAG TPA: hypothetical protein [Caudoviricetes sp.]
MKENRSLQGDFLYTLFRVRPSIHDIKLYGISSIAM